MPLPPSRRSGTVGQVVLSQVSSTSVILVSSSLTHRVLTLSDLGAEKENVELQIAPETQKLNWYVLLTPSRLAACEKSHANVSLPPTGFKNTDNDNRKLNTSPSTVEDKDVLKKFLTTPPVKKIDLHFPLGLEVTARNLKGVTIKDALDAIHKQFKKKVCNIYPSGCRSHLRLSFSTSPFRLAIADHCTRQMMSSTTQSWQASNGTGKNATRGSLYTRRRKAQLQLQARRARRRTPKESRYLSHPSLAYHHYRSFVVPTIGGRFKEMRHAWHDLYSCLS